MPDFISTPISFRQRPAHLSAGARPAAAGALPVRQRAGEVLGIRARETWQTVHSVAGLCAPILHLTHTVGLAACAVSRQQDVGIDAERIDRSGFLEIANTALAPLKLHTLWSTPKAGQAEQFFTYWTLKEACVKARGSGLSTDFQDFAIHIDSDCGAAIEFLRGEHQDPEDWQLRLFRPTPEPHSSCGATNARACEIRHSRGHSPNELTYASHGDLWKMPKACVTSDRAERYSC
jgi:hypothetical protein